MRPLCGLASPIFAGYTVTMIRKLGIDIPTEAVAAFCREWRVAELSLFGSARDGILRDESDVDLLVTFNSQAKWTLLDLVTMEESLANIFGRPVDLVTRGGVERSANRLRKKAILETAEPIYVAR